MTRMPDASLKQHLVRRVREYFPDARSVNVTFNDDDALVLVVDETFAYVQTNHNDSDADWFEFFNRATRRTMTIPFNPE